MAWLAVFLRAVSRSKATPFKFGKKKNSANVEKISDLFTSGMSKNLEFLDVADF